MCYRNVHVLGIPGFLIPFSFAIYTFYSFSGCQLLTTLEISRNSVHTLTTADTVSWRRMLFNLLGRSAKWNFLSFPKRLVQSCLPLAFPSAFRWSRTSNETPEDLITLIKLYRCNPFAIPFFTVKVIIFIPV